MAQPDSTFSIRLFRICECQQLLALSPKGGPRTDPHEPRSVEEPSLGRQCPAPGSGLSGAAPVSPKRTAKLNRRLGSSRSAISRRRRREEPSGYPENVRQNTPVHLGANEENHPDVSCEATKLRGLHRGWQYAGPSLRIVKRSPLRS